MCVYERVMSEWERFCPVCHIPSTKRGTTQFELHPAPAICSLDRPLPSRPSQLAALFSEPHCEREVAPTAANSPYRFLRRSAPAIMKPFINWRIL